MPVNPDLKLSEKILDSASLDQKPTREGYGLGLLAAGEENEDVVALCADLTASTRTDLFAEKFPERFVEMGVQEQNMAAVASGMAAMGKIPYITSYAMFSPGRNWEQIRTTVCYNNQNVKIIGSHAGVSVGPDGATHQAIEDIAITRVIPNMVVLAPCDMEEGKKAAYAVSKIPTPAYIRYVREKTPVFTTGETPFEIGKAPAFWIEPAGEKPGVAIVACGPLLHNAILAAAMLEREGMGVRVLNAVSIKPLDEDAVTAAARDAGAVVTVEEHQISGGLGSAVAELLSRKCPVPMEFVGVGDRFGESGDPNELIEQFGMGVSHIAAAAKKAFQRKGGG